MRIKQIKEADFRSSELSLFREFSARNRSVAQQLRRDDVVVFVSKTGNQILFVHGFTPFLEGPNGARREALMSIRHRIIGGTWNPLRLANYALEAGIEVQGLRLYEEHLKRMLEG